MSKLPHPPVATSGVVLHVPNLNLPGLIILSTLIFNTLRPVFVYRQCTMYIL